MPYKRGMSKDPSKAPEYSVRDFFARFPDDEACINHIMDVRFGTRHVCRKCGVESTFHRMSDRRAFACAACGDHLYPTAGTVFEDTRTPLQLWFYAIYLFVTTRHGVSGKELQRQLGVTYKTAWRMGMKIRELIGSIDEFDMLQGHVELDEAYVGGRRPGIRGRGAKGKTIVMGMNEHGGVLRTEIIPNVKTATLRNVVLRNVEKGSVVSTVEMLSYQLLTGEGYVHGRVKHSDKVWRAYDEQTGHSHSTNSVENFWGLFKRSVRSTHIHVSNKYMDRYLAEFTFRPNHRMMQNAMFDLIVAKV